MRYQGRALLASVIFALLVYLLIETFTDLHERIQRVLILHPQIVFLIIVQMFLACIAFYIHYTNRYDKRRIGNALACISLLFTLYITWLCYH
jgi:hypothetical protein